MMKKSGKIIFFFGCLLFAVGLGLLFMLKFQTKRAENINTEIVQTMEMILSDYREGMKEPDYATEMPALEIQGEDFIALLEIPVYGLKLPVCNVWDKTKAVSYPCRFSGTASQGTLVIGGYDQEGQFDFFDRILDGIEVFVTDMTGSTFSYVVDRVERSKSAKEENLIKEGSDLTLFVRDAQLLEYVMLRCVLK